MKGRTEFVRTTRIRMDTERCTKADRTLSSFYILHSTLKKIAHSGDFFICSTSARPASGFPPNIRS